MRIRRATAQDAPAMLEVKARLPMPRASETVAGGFLLGTSLERYLEFIERDFVLVLEDDSGVVLGFSVVQGFESLQASDLWQRRSLIDPPLVIPGRVAYCEQLAVLPDASPRVHAKYLAYLSLRWAFTAHEIVAATVVRAPIHNRAVVPFLEAAGFELVGRVQETYPVVGVVESDVYAVSRAGFEHCVRQARWQHFLARVAALEAGGRLGGWT